MSPTPVFALVALLALAQAAPAQIAADNNQPRAVKISGRQNWDPKEQLGKRADGSHNADFMKRDFLKMQAKMTKKNNIELDQRKFEKRASTKKSKKAAAKAAAAAAAKAKIVPASSKLALLDEISEGQDLEYYGPVSFGTPAQVLQMDFDTGSADTWVPTKKIAGSAGWFNPAKSTTNSNSGKKFSIAYDEGSSSGTIMYDVMTIGSLSVPKQAIGAVTKESEDWYGDAAAGLVGLAFSSISQMNKPTFFENLVSQKRLTNNLFALSLARNQTTGSELSIGAVDSTKFTGAITYHPLTSQTYWQIKAYAHVNGKQVGSSFNAAIDSGTTYNFVPQAVAKAMFATVPGSSRNAAQSSSGYDVYQYPCNSTATIGLSFTNPNSQTWLISAADLNAGTVGTKGMCISTITGTDIEGLSSGLIAVIGDSFLKNVYSVFNSDKKAVGFASVA